jgi:hypothetical protein
MIKNCVHNSCYWSKHTVVQKIIAASKEPGQPAHLDLYCWLTTWNIDADISKMIWYMIMASSKNGHWTSPGYWLINLFYFTECYGEHERREVVCGSEESFTESYSCKSICSKYVHLLYLSFWFIQNLF